jgi:hypothetical protein
MMKKLLVTLAVLALAPATAFAAGSLALNGNQGDAYGWAVNYPSQTDADNEARNQCGYGCGTVMRFSGSCAAYAADQTQGSTAMGWGSGYRSAGEAQMRAVQECQARGGTQCIVRAWGCDQG